MKRNVLVLSALLLLTSCSPKNGGEGGGEETKNNISVAMKNEGLTIVNFADLHFETTAMFSEDSIPMKTIRNCMSTQKPDVVTFSGDNAWGSRTVDWYIKICQIMDEYNIPYFFVLGNHERESVLASDIAYYVNQSQHGYFEMGDAGGSSYGNYVVDIKNQSNEVVHKLIMMDSRDYCTPSEADYTYISHPIDGVKYRTRVNPNTFQSTAYYGTENYDTIRDEQITWYKKQVKNPRIESTLITHMPIREYTKAIEQYKSAVNRGDQTTIDSISSIGNCTMGEPVACSAKDYGFFQTMKSCGSTKNMICGHDHYNDYSLKFNGIRLTYAVKTGNGCYWDETGNTNGCTTIKIDATGAASISQYYFKVN